MRRVPRPSPVPAAGSDDSRVAEVKSLSYSASGVARYEGKVAFIPYTVTGDVVRFVVTGDKKTYADGRLVEILKSSPHRRPPPCPYFGRCGGCQWQHVAYPYQLQAKTTITKDLLERIGGIKNPPVTDVRNAGEEWHYRQRVRFQVGRRDGGVQFGFSVFGSNDVVDIESCHIVRKPIAGLLKELRRMKDRLASFYDFEVYAAADGTCMFSGVSREPVSTSTIGEIGKLFKGGVVVDKRSRKAVTVGDPYLLYGIETALSSYRLKVYGGGFVQANPEMNSMILNVLADRLGGMTEGRMLELYAGSGNFTMLFSRLFSHVVAVEGEPVSFRALEENITRNNAKNVTVSGGAVTDEVTRLFNRKRRFDAIFLDPPRIGAKEIMPFVSKLGAETILYLSCNPSTLARDVETLVFNGYELETVIPFDMFPQTFHIEALAVLKKV